MTTKQIAEAVGKTERSVRNWANAVAVDSSAMKEKISSSTSTYPADYDLEETLQIIKHGMGKNAADLFRMSAEAESKLPTTIDRDAMLIKIMETFTGVAQSLTTAILSLGSRVTDLESKVQIEAPINFHEEFASLVEKEALKYGGNHMEPLRDCYKRYQAIYDEDLRAKAKADDKTQSVMGYARKYPVVAERLYKIAKRVFSESHQNQLTLVPTVLVRKLAD